MPNSLILDTDGGVDDAQALLMLLANGCAPTAITTVFGNVSLPAATRNILATLATADVQIPVYKGAEVPLEQPRIDAKYIHGEDGLGGAPVPDDIGQAQEQDAIAFLCNALNGAADAGTKIDLLLIGPLTNLALVLQRDPDAIKGIGQVTIMGGTVYGRGNTTPAAEFNIFADPEAAQIVFAADLSIRVVPWEPCMSHAITGAQVDALFADLPETPVRRFSKALADHARRTIEGYGGGDNFRFVDPLAAAVVIAPEIVTRSVSACVCVALGSGLTRGMTVVDPSGRLGTPKAELVEKADLEKVVGFYANSIR